MTEIVLRDAKKAGEKIPCTLYPVPCTLRDAKKAGEKMAPPLLLTTYYLLLTTYYLLLTKEGRREDGAALTYSPTYLPTY